MKLEQLKRARENKGVPVTNSLLAGVACGGGGDAGDGVSQTQPGPGPQAQLSEGVGHGDGPQAEPHIMSKSAAKLSSCQQTHEEAATATPTPDSQQWTLTHMRQLGECVKGLLCPDCYGDDVSICISGHMGFSSELTLRCQSCPYTKKVHTSPTVGSTKAYAINTVMTVLAHELGVAHAGLEKIGKVLGIPPIHLNTYQRHDRRVSAAEFEAGQDCLRLAASRIREAYLDTHDDDSEPDVLDICVSYDGTWMKRGFSSMYGAGVATDILIGLVIDFEVMSLYCHACVEADHRQWAGGARERTSSVGGKARRRLLQELHRLAQSNGDGGRQTHLAAFGRALPPPIHGNAIRR